VSINSEESIPTRSEPSSRTFLIGEQPNAWDLLQPRAKVSRHRCRFLSPITERIGLYLHPFNQLKGVGVLAAPMSDSASQGSKSLRGHNPILYAIEGMM
jgi:hypothetical protein